VEPQAFPAATDGCRRWDRGEARRHLAERGAGRGKARRGEMWGDEENAGLSAEWNGVT
jgi:hypothetical protein